MAATESPEYAAGRELARQLVRMESKNHQLEMLLKQALKLASEATNGWACHAKRRSEHDEIARLHQEIRLLQIESTR